MTRCLPAPCILPIYISAINRFDRVNELTFIQKFMCSCSKSTGTHEFGFPVGFTSQFLMMISLKVG